MTSAALGFTVVISILALGGVHPEVMLLLGLASSVALAGALICRSDEPIPVRELGPAVVLFALAAWSLVQVLPLPLDVVELIAPSNADIWARSLMPLGEEAPFWACISVDPGATKIEALRWFSYGAIFISAATLARSRGPGWGITVVFAATVAAALVTLAHGLAGVSKVYGIYTPTFHPQPWHVGPLLNPNNLAGLLNLGALAGLGMLLSERTEVPRWAVGVGVAVLVGVDVSSGSRGGVVMLLVGVVVLAVWQETRGIRRARPMRGRLVLGGVLALGTVLALLSGTAAMWRELLDENVEKLEMVSMVRPVVGDFPFLGIGRGAFESVFPAYQRSHGHTVFTHAENFVAQWVVEWGIPVAAVALVAFGYFFRPGRLRIRRSMMATGAWIGVMGVLAQNLVDLGLEIPGLCFAVVVVLGTLWGGHERDDPPASVRISQRALRRGGAALAAGVAVMLLAGGGRHDVVRDREHIQAALKAAPHPRDDAQRAALRAHIRAAIDRHPAEPYFPLMGALIATEAGDENPIPWLQRVLERSMVNGRAHLLLAQVLERYGSHKQALLELRLAVESDSVLVGAASRLALRFTQDLDELAEAVPRNESAGHMWDGLGAVAEERALGAACDQRALAAEPTRIGPRSRLASDLIAAAESEKACTEPHDRARCEAEIAFHVAVMERLSPRTSLAARTLARWQAATGDADAAERALAERCDAVTDYLECLQARARIAAKLDSKRFEAAAKALRSSSCTDQVKCARSNTWLGDIYSQREEYGNAVVAYERALRDEVDDDRLLKLANAAAKANLNSKAMRALEKLLARRGGKDPELQKRIADERQRVVNSILQP